MPALHSPPPVNCKRKESEEYESKLHEIWNRFFIELVEYKETNGHCNCPTTNGSLGRWIARQKSLFKSNKLKADRHDKLVEIGFTFDHVSNIWNRHFMELVEYKKMNGHCNFPTNKGSFGIWVSKQRALFISKKLEADRHAKLVGIGFVFEDARFAMGNVKWNTRFVELVEYKEENGHCNCPTKNGSLGSWISKQRKLFKSNKVKADRYEKLVGIGFIFEDVIALEFKGKLDQQWQDMYQKLLEHKETKGHCFDLPRTIPLGRWLSQQRDRYRNGNLREDREEKLLSIGFADKKGLKKGGAVGVREASSGQPPRKKRKEEDLDNDLAAITHDEGEKGIDDINAEDDINDNDNANEDVVEEHTVAVTELVEEGSITDKDGNVTSFAEMPTLHSPPPVNSKRKHNQEYESKHDEKWNKHFMELVEYKETNGHCNCPIKEIESLGMWIWHQRRLFRSKKLKADRREKLVGIGLIFKDAKFPSNNVKWNTRFIELEKYKEKNGHCNCPQKNGSLGKWISTQRNLFTSEKLKADHYKKLMGIGFEFEDARFAMENENWNTRFVELVEYKQKNGHCNIPTKNGFLGTWVAHQRGSFRSKKLKEDRHEKLVEIGFAFEDVTALELKGKLDQQWQDMYQKLLEHKETKGHCFNVPQTLPLGRWLRLQRQLYRNGNLREDREEKLLSIGFADKKGLKKGGAVGVRDASSGQPPRKKRKVDDLDNDLAAITHNEGEKGIDDINDNGDVNDNVNAHEEVVEEHAVAATELVEVEIKQGQKKMRQLPPWRRSMKCMKTVQV
eukprot:scaffold2205_cov268-Chaetoceros_neogracile.AAC.1